MSRLKNRLALFYGNGYRHTMSANPIAAALGKLGRGRKKTMTPAAMLQRQNAVKSRWAKAARKKKRRGPVIAAALLGLACLGGAGIILFSEPTPAPHDGYAVKLEGGIEIVP